jgi:hypothetical protein
MRIVARIFRTIFLSVCLRGTYIGAKGRGKRDNKRTQKLTFCNFFSSPSQNWWFKRPGSADDAFPENRNTHWFARDCARQLREANAAHSGCRPDDFDAGLWARTYPARRIMQAPRSRREQLEHLLGLPSAAPNADEPPPEATQSRMLRAAAPVPQRSRQPLLSGRGAHDAVAAAVQSVSGRVASTGSSVRDMVQTATTRDYGRLLAQQLPMAPQHARTVGRATGFGAGVAAAAGRVLGPGVRP